MAVLRDIENVLDVYEFTDILEVNDLDITDVLLFLVNEEFLELPEIKPINFDD